jgi:hypothetical protein
MDATDPATEAFLAKIRSATRRRDAATLIELMRRVTGEEPEFRDKAVGFGTYHYRYASGREGDASAAAFAARNDATVVYLNDGVGSHAEAIARLGPHRTGVGCLYFKDLATIDLALLESIVGTSYATLTRGTYTNRAREGGEA